MYAQDLINEIKKIPVYEVNHLNKKDIFLNRADVVNVIIKYFAKNNLNNVPNFKFIIGD